MNHDTKSPACTALVRYEPRSLAVMHCRKRLVRVYDSTPPSPELRAAMRKFLIACYREMIGQLEQPWYECPVCKSRKCRCHN